ncbi:MAG: hypothetical protein PHR60_02490 [Eubacteriales bacterium]|nr:hypothetical protein [Eubacteriales bacterium]
MKLEGIWEGVLFIENLRHYIKDELFKLMILSVVGGTNVWGKVIEEKYTDGLKENQTTEVDTYLVQGKVNTLEGKLCLTGIREDSFRIELQIDSVNQIMKGVYFKKNGFHARTIIELKKINKTFR